MVRVLLSIFLVVFCQCLAKANDAELGTGIYGISLGENHEIAAVNFNERGFRGTEKNFEFYKNVSSKDECLSGAVCETLTYTSYSDDYSAKNPKWRVGAVTLYKQFRRHISVDLLLESIEKHFGKLQANGGQSRSHHFFRSTENLTEREKALIRVDEMFWFGFDTQDQNPFTACDYKGQLIKVEIYFNKATGKTNSFRINLIDNGLMCDAKVARDAHILKLDNDTAKGLSFD